MDKHIETAEVIDLGTATVETKGNSLFQHNDSVDQKRDPIGLTAE